MDRQILNFTANEQILVCDNPIKISTNKVNYIEARFDLGTNWSGYDSVRAVWFNDFQCISTVLDSQGVTFVPFEVMKRRGNVKVNLVGSISENDVLTDRLTSYPVVAVIVDCIAQITGAETNPITPSQFEQFVTAVISEVEKVTGMTAQAETLPAGSQATARYENGILYLGIPQGIQGERGETGADGNGIASVVYNADYTLTLVFTNGERFTTPPIRGERGPAGQDGRDGTNGRDGADGVTPSLSVGTVTTLPSTEDAYVTRRGTDENPVFDFGIPQGPKGDKGDPGEVTMSQLSALLPTDTASGDIASITDGQNIVPVKSLKVTLEPIQSGSGTPSPDNVRPISGHTECVTYVSPTTSETDAEVYTTTLGRTVYGGTLDVVSGELVVDRAMVTFDGTENWVKTSAGNAYYLTTNNTAFPYGKDHASYNVCDKYAFKGFAISGYISFLSDGEYLLYTYPSGNTIREIAFKNESIASVADWKASLQSNPLQVVYELSTPQTYQLTPTEVDLLLGQNNLWTDCGAVEVTYKADIQRWVLKKLSE